MQPNFITASLERTCKRTEQLYRTFFHISSHSKVIRYSTKIGTPGHACISCVVREIFSGLVTGDTQQDIAWKSDVLQSFVCVCVFSILYVEREALAVLLVHV